MFVLGIETSTTQTSVAVGNENGVVAAAVLGRGEPNHEVVTPAIRQALEWSKIRLTQLTGIAVGLGPGLFTGMRVGIATAKTMAQSLSIPIAGFASLDVIALQAQHARRLVCSVIDAKRGEVFFAFYRPVPAGVARQGTFEALLPDRLAAELEAIREDVLVVGNGGLAYRSVLQEAGPHVEFASAAYAYPRAAGLVELAIPRFQREDFDRLFDLQPIYLRKSDAEIAWDKRRGGA